MLKTARSMLVLLTVLAAFAAGAMNGLVLCVNGVEHVAVEEVHCCTNEAGREHDHHQHDESDHGSGRCLDIQADVTLVREGAASPLQNVHFLLAPMLVPPVLTPALLPIDAVIPVAEHSGPPPAFDDLARLADIILLA